MNDKCVNEQKIRSAPWSFLTVEQLVSKWGFSVVLENTFIHSFISIQP